MTKLSALKYLIRNLIKEEVEDFNWELYEKRLELLTDTICNYKENRHGKQKWNYIPFELYKRILNDYLKFNEIRPQFYKYIDKIIGIIIHNILQISVNTELAGHTSQFPIEEIEDCGLTEEDFEDFDDFDNYISDSNGALRISDYALTKLEQKALELDSLDSYEEKLFKIEQILQTIHQRSDIASWFIEGGTPALSKLSGFERNEKETLEFMNIIQDLIAKLKDIESYLKTSDYNIIQQLNTLLKELNNNPESHNITKTDIETIKDKAEIIIQRVHETKEFKENSEKIKQLKKLYADTNDPENRYQIRTLLRTIQSNPHNKITLQQINDLTKQKITESLKRKKLGKLPIDSGQALFVDPAYINSLESSIKKMNQGEIKPNKNGSLNLKNSFYFAQFGGDGDYEIYGVYDTKSEDSHIPIELIIKIRKDIIKEGTSSFLPGNGDDSTSDYLHDINEKISKIVNKEIRKLENQILNPKKKTKEEYFFDKWRYANLISTALKKGFLIEPSLINKAIKYYESVLKDSKKEQYLLKSLKDFNKEVKKVLELLKKQKSIKTHSKIMYFYAPNFI